MDITGPVDGSPCKVGVAMTDLQTGLHAYGSILAALLARHRTGRGARIECSLLETQVASLANVASACEISLQAPNRIASLPLPAPCAPFYPPSRFTLSVRGFGILVDVRFGAVCPLRLSGLTRCFVFFANAYS